MIEPLIVGALIWLAVIQWGMRRDAERRHQEMMRYVTDELLRLKGWSP